MTDEELITALRMRAESDLCQAAADRLEALSTGLEDIASGKHWMEEPWAYAQEVLDGVPHD